MKMIRFAVICLLLAVMMASCATKPGEERGRVLCPACGTEFDALYQKRF